MPEQSQTSGETIIVERRGGLWSGWAAGMLIGLLAVGGVFIGMTRVLHEERQWAHAANAFEIVCANQQRLTALRNEVVRQNRELRASFRRLEPRHYPADDVVVFGLADEPVQEGLPTEEQESWHGLAPYTCKTKPPVHDPAPWHNFVPWLYENPARQESGDAAT